MKKVLIMAGGTGGHVMPALAVARYLQAQGFNLHWLGTRHGFEARFIPQTGIPISYIDIQGLRRTHWFSWFMAPWRLTKALVQAAHIVLKERPNVVLSMGGYAAGPGALAAWLLRRPLVLHEQNAIAGWTNRLLSRFAKRILVAFPNVFAQIPQKVIFTGNPVREDILALDQPDLRYAKREHVRVLILGGSQGAKILNEIVPQAIALFDKDKRPVVWHQTGQNNLEQTKAEYNQKGITAQITDFIQDMAQAYVWADIVICRSGALTVSEIAATGVCSILIPFPYAVDDHQTSNAQYLSAEGGAILLPQSILTVEMLYNLLQELTDNPHKRLKIAMASRKLAKPLATKDVAKYCLEVSSDS
ncbi:MAG: undecaprenyldiphospho-muramoylpentapeptide beta-N-acetylglucosaminyltransferase [Proteobacteria bacterium]|nr:undecaprenyldiphospho-muramoylpentapeptide beta-N-acetylglucosaminyltransferase [Pseudomonadota bacterium]